MRLRGVLGSAAPMVAPSGRADPRSTLPAARRTAVVAMSTSGARGQYGMYGDDSSPKVVGAFQSLFKAVAIIADFAWGEDYEEDGGGGAGAREGYYSGAPSARAPHHPGQLPIPPSPERASWSPRRWRQPRADARRPFPSAVRRSGPPQLPDLSGSSAEGYYEEPGHESHEVANSRFLQDLVGGASQGAQPPRHTHLLPCPRDPARPLAPPRPDLA